MTFQDSTFQNSTGMRLRHAYMSLHRYAQSLFASFGVTADQYVLLSVLAEEQGLSQRELADAICSDANTIGAMLRLLEEKGLVRRRPDQSDARARIVQISAKGRRLQKQLDACAEPLHRDLQEALGAAELTRLKQSLRKIEGVVREASEGAVIAG